MQGRWDDVSGAIGVGTKGNAVVTVKSLTVAHPKGARPGEGGQPGEGAPSGEGFFIDVPCAKSDATTRAATVPAAAPVTAAATTAPAAAMIERPAFRDAPKPIVKSLSSITAMATLHADDGQAVGATVDLIATVPLESRQGIKAAAGFHRNEVDEATRAEFDEALRAVELRYPIWEPGRIEFSFGGETALPRVGPSSAGTAFAVLMLSCLEGFDVDRNCALTGDVSVDWRVRKAGGVVAGLRAAAASGKCLYAGIPADDAAAIPDMAILHGNDALWATQVFTISNLHEAVALARTDRPDRLAKAIAMFAELRQALTANSRAALHAASTKAKLREILELAPNHLSARCVLALCDGTAPRTLSADATRYQLSAIYYPYLPLLDGNKGKPIDRTTLPKPVTVAARKRLAVLRPIAHKDYQPAVGDVGALIETMDELADHSISLATAERRLQDVQARIGEVVGDAKAVERAVREGY
jgi:hypothetical protein